MTLLLVSLSLSHNYYTNVSEYSIKESDEIIVFANWRDD